MAGFDLDSALRWSRAARRFRPGKGEKAKPSFLSANHPAESLLLDTCVYIDQLQDKLPRFVEAVIVRTHVIHSAIAISELIYPIGWLDPDHPGTAGVIKEISGSIRDVPDFRMFEPDADTLGRAAIVAGVLCRLYGYAKDDRLRATNDCVLFLQALKLGVIVLTRNIGDFDVLQQMFPAGRVLFYQTV